MVAGYGGIYGATVVDDVDPLQGHRLRLLVPDPRYQRRLLVRVPEVDFEPAWAVAAGAAEHGEPPTIGAGVWVEYEYGDPAHPRWVGLA